MPIFYNLFRGRTSRFWSISIILLISFKMLFDSAPFVIHWHCTTIRNSDAKLPDGRTVRTPIQGNVIFANKDGIYTTAAIRSAVSSQLSTQPKQTHKNKVLVPATTKPPSTKKLNPATTKKLSFKATTKKPRIDMVNDYQPYIDFKFVYPEVQPTIKGLRDFYMVVLVNSGAKGDHFRKRRAKIRETWASKHTCENTNAMNSTKLKDYKWILVFVLGKAGNVDQDKRNVEEAKEHNDMIIGDIYDNYLNNILKFYMGQLWASFLDAKYTLKTDDDVYVRIPKVIEHLVSLGSPLAFYGGITYKNTPVFRSVGGKWSISHKYFPEKLYPPYNGGAFFILSTDLLGSLMNYVYIRKPFHTDDAYVGVAMRDFKVKVVNLPTFDIRGDMPTFIRTKSDCDILKLVAYSHRVDTDAMHHLHGRVEGLCYNDTTLKGC